MNNIKYCVSAIIIFLGVLVFHIPIAPAENFYDHCDEYNNIISTIDQEILNYIFVAHKICEDDIECIIKIGPWSYVALTFDNIILGFNIEPGTLDNIVNAPMDTNDGGNDQAEQQILSNTASRKEYKDMMDSFRIKINSLYTNLGTRENSVLLDELKELVKDPYWWEQNYNKFVTNYRHLNNAKFSVGEDLLRYLGMYLEYKDDGYDELIELYDFAIGRYNIRYNYWIDHITASAIKGGRISDALVDLEALFEKPWALATQFNQPEASKKDKETYQPRFDRNIKKLEDELNKNGG